MTSEDAEQGNNAGIAVENGKAGTTTSDPPEWTDSAARAYLYALLIAGDIPSNKQPKEVFNEYCKDRPEFKDFQDYSKFGSRLYYLRKKAAQRKGRADEDDEALAHDRNIFPLQTEDTRGRPIWAGSEAQKLLRQDIENDLHKTKKPKELYEEREEYYNDFDLDFFRNKIYQEQKALKRAAWVKAKSEDKSKKKKKKKKNKK